MSRGALSLVLILSLGLGPGCASRDPSGTPSTEAPAQAFEHLYAAWRKECETIQYSSNTHDYIVLPSYRKIVGMGRPALPFLAEKMTEGAGGDFMLASAVVEICGWDRRDFVNGSEQEFRDKVLQRLKDSH